MEKYDLMYRNTDGEKYVPKFELNFLPEGKPQHHQQRGQPWQRLQKDIDEEHNLQNKSFFIFQPKQLEFYHEANYNCCKRNPVSCLLASIAMEATGHALH